jgi:hypothetical protein
MGAGRPWAERLPLSQQEVGLPLGAGELNSCRSVLTSQADAHLKGSHGLNVECNHPRELRTRPVEGVGVLGGKGLDAQPLLGAGHKGGFCMD